MSWVFENKIKKTVEIGITIKDSQALCLTGNIAQSRLAEKTSPR
jgi:hypothetical protein